MFACCSRCSASDQALESPGDSPAHQKSSRNNAVNSSPIYVATPRCWQSTSNRVGYQVDMMCAVTCRECTHRWRVGFPVLKETDDHTGLFWNMSVAESTARCAILGNHVVYTGNTRATHAVI